MENVCVTCRAPIIRAKKKTIISLCFGWFYLCDIVPLWWIYMRIRFAEYYKNREQLFYWGSLFTEIEKSSGSENISQPNRKQHPFFYLFQSFGVIYNTNSPKRQQLLLAILFQCLKLNCLLFQTCRNCGKLPSTTRTVQRLVNHKPPTNNMFPIALRAYDLSSLKFTAFVSLVYVIVRWVIYDSRKKNSYTRL